MNKSSPRYFCNDCGIEWDGITRIWRTNDPRLLYPPVSNKMTKQERAECHEEDCEGTEFLIVFSEELDEE